MGNDEKIAAVQERTRVPRAAGARKRAAARVISELCTGCITLFGGFMVIENIVPVESVCFVITMCFWGFFLQPSILNNCHLTLWLLVFQAFRNLFIVESHATTGWGFATMADAYRLVK